MGKEKKPKAWIELRLNDPATINLLNDDGWGEDYKSEADLNGFEWNVYTINDRLTEGRYTKDRIFVGFRTYKEAEAYTVAEGYCVMTQDISEHLYKYIQQMNITNINQ